MTDLNEKIKSKNFVSYSWLDIEDSINTNNQNISEEMKIPLNLIIDIPSLNMLKSLKSNIFIEIENKYHCSISKKVDVICFFLLYL